MDYFTLAVYTAGAVLAFFSSWAFVGRLLQRVAPWSEVPTPDGIPSVTWNEIVSGPGGRGARLLGQLEATMSYLALLGFSKDAAVVIGGWFAFKVASKWETWHNIVQIPDTLESATQLEYLKARRAWGTLLYLRFLIGTLANVGCGLAVFAIIRFVLSPSNLRHLLSGE